MIDFNNTEVAFAYRSRRDLIRAYNMFYLMKYNNLVKWGTDLTMRAWDRGMTLPVSMALRSTVYHLFCGGESLQQVTPAIDRLARHGVRVILDFGTEGKDADKDFDRTAAEVQRAIVYAAENKAVPIVSSKFTGLIRFAILEKLQAGEVLSEEEQASLDRSKGRIDAICRLAHEHRVSLSVDAEESWIQDPLDAIVYEMMARYNGEYPVIYNTVQLYLRQRVERLQEAHRKARREGFIFAVKLVRGAYMEKERKRAAALGYENPVQMSKEDCDRDFDLAVTYCLNNLEDISVCIATHNENSCQRAADQMAAAGISPGDRRVWFSQLYGMSDHISFNMAGLGFNATKYMPYGPVRDVVPYLVRRAQENTSVAGQMGRELSLLRQEMKRRKLKWF